MLAKSEKSEFMPFWAGLGISSRQLIWFIPQDIANITIWMQLDHVKALWISSQYKVVGKNNDIFTAVFHCVSVFLNHFINPDCWFHRVCTLFSDNLKARWRVSKGRWVDANRRAPDSQSIGGKIPLGTACNYSIFEKSLKFPVAGLEQGQKKGLEVMTVKAKINLAIRLAAVQLGVLWVTPILEVPGV